MSFSRQTNCRLHDEHVAVIALLARFNAALLAAREPAALLDEAARPLLREVARALTFEVTAHFGFEERVLFGLMREAGEGELVEHFLEEHRVVNEAAARLSPLLSRACEGALGAGEAASLKAAGLELCDRLTAHAEREEGALLPLLEQLLDDDVDRASLLAYANA